MKKVFIIIIICIFILIIGFFSVGGGQAYTPAENRITGNCKVFSSTAIYPWYKRSDKCRAFWSIDMRFKTVESYDKSNEDYFKEISQYKDIIKKQCFNLDLEQQDELFLRHNVKSCMELAGLLK